MEEGDWAIYLDSLGLSTEGIGPPAEWDPVDRDTHYNRHNEFWSWVDGMMPDNEWDEPFWMTQGATTKLLSNS